jgi:PilZ domain
MSEEELNHQAPQSPRAVRLDTHRVRLDTADGILLNLSATGALVRTPRRLAAAADSTLSLNADDRWVQLRCRVVRSTETEIRIQGAVWRHTEFETAVTFNDPDGLGTLLGQIGRPRSIHDE